MKTLADLPLERLAELTGLFQPTQGCQVNTGQPDEARQEVIRRYHKEIKDEAHIGLEIRRGASGRERERTEADKAVHGNGARATSAKVTD